MRRRNRGWDGSLFVLGLGFFFFVRFSLVVGFCCSLLECEEEDIASFVVWFEEVFEEGVDLFSGEESL